MHRVLQILCESFAIRKVWFGCGRCVPRLAAMRPHFPPSRRFLIALLALAIGVVGGCGGSDGPAASSTVPPTTPDDTTQSTSTPTDAPPVTTSTSDLPATGASVSVFFADESAQGLVEETRTVEQADLRSALLALAEGPSAGGAVAALPAGTEVVGTLIRDGEATVNLNQAFQDGYPSGGAAAEFAVLAPLVYTVTSLDGVERVRITVEGRTPAPTGSQYDWTQAFTRADFPGVVASP